MTKLSHEYVPANLVHSNLICKWCCGTPAENAVIEPNGCAARDRKTAEAEKAKS